MSGTAWVRQCVGAVGIGLGLGLTAVFAIGCGDSREDPRSAVVATLTAIQDRARTGDGRGVCARISAEARQRFVPVADGNCASGLAKLLETDAPTGRVLGAAVDGRRATARVVLAPRLSGRVTLTERRERWIVDDLAILPPEVDGKAPELGFGAWRDSPRGRRVPCPPVHGRRGGGCLAQVEPAPTKIILLTAVGALPVARCQFGYRLHVGDPIYLADEVRFSGPGLCERIDHCPDGETGLRYPWLGNGLRTSSASIVRVYFDVCINTPVGRARGFLLTRLTRTAGNWRAQTYDGPIGISSFQLVGAWDLEPDDFGIGELPPGRIR
jgi:hypothetical protein